MREEQVTSPCYLIVDDSPLNLRWLAQILRSIGPAETLHASDGVEAVERLASVGGRVDAIISDLQMPKMNGLELLKEVRLARTGGQQSTPFLIITSFTERAYAGLALGLDVDAFLARPVKRHALGRHLSRVCTERRSVRSAAEAHATYGDVDLSLAATAAEEPFALPPPCGTTAPLEETHQDGTVVLLEERHMPLESVPQGAILARDAANSAGAVLLKAGEELTASLRAVLMSYAEIDESLAKVWVRQ